MFVFITAHLGCIADTEIRIENQGRNLLGWGESDVAPPESKMNVVNVNDYRFLKSSFRAQQILNY